MRLDVIDYREFYEQPLGRVVRRLLNAHIRAIWPTVRDQSVMGVGYASPFLDMFRQEAERVINVMPSGQGVTRWPTQFPNLTMLAEDGALPLSDASVDRVILAHSLENTEQVRVLLRDIWRVLAGGGRMLIVTPSRRGLWARVERTPFGHGRPYSKSQLTNLLRDTQFEPLQWREALFMPPFNWHFLVRTATAWERWGNRIWPRFPGVYAVEVSKQIYARTGERKRVSVLRPVPLPAPAAVARDATIVR